MIFAKFSTFFAVALLNDCQSRLSMESSSSDDASLIINNMVNIFNDPGFEHVHSSNSEDISKLSFSHMMCKESLVFHTDRAEAFDDIDATKVRFNFCEEGQG